MLKRPLILVADDDRNQVRLVRTVMERENYEIMEAANGLECLEKFAQCLPDIILLDAIMPEMDGFECCAHLQTLSESKHIPILIITALEDEASVDKAFAAGASDYITKPIHWPVLKKRIRHLLEASRNLQDLESLNQELERKVLERTAQLMAQVEELQKLDQLKDDFISTVSHELRTPLTAIQMALFMMNKGGSEAKIAQYYQIAVEQCNKEIALINDVLDLQRLQTHASDLNPVAINIGSLMQSLIQPVKIKADQRGQILTLTLLQDPITLYTELDGLERILRELLENACKYTPPQGEIQIWIKASIAGVEFRFSNTATISSQELPRLFERFYRIPRSNPWQQSGTGLGLALVKRLLQRLAGDIEVTSENNWTTFTIWIPNLVSVSTPSQSLTTLPTP